MSMTPRFVLHAISAAVFGGALITLALVVFSGKLQWRNSIGVGSWLTHALIFHIVVLVIHKAPSELVSLWSSGVYLQAAATALGMAWVTLRTNGG